MAEDKYTNIAYLTVTQSAANTMTFGKLETGIALHEKVAWLLHQVHYFVTLNTTQFANDDDILYMGLSVSDALSAVTPNQSSIVDRYDISRVDIGAAATGTWVHAPFIRDWTNLPMGGILVPPNPLYIFAHSSGLAAAQTVSARLFYTSRPLKTEEFWELVEIRRIIGT